jgi:hypothetical protein
MASSLFPKKPANPGSAKPTPKPAPLPRAIKPSSTGRSSAGGQRRTVRI